MRRSSIITTLFLVLVIIGLVVALVVTNLPPKQEVTDLNNEQVVGEENVGEEKEEVETPTYVALDSDIAKNMTKMLKPIGHDAPGNDYFYTSKNGTFNFEDLTDMQKMEVAYAFGGESLDEREFGEKDGIHYVCKMKKSDLDNMMLKIFGKVDYIPQDFYAYKYFPDEEVFYGVGRGGGGEVPQPIIGTYKIEEYEERYEMYQKYIFKDPYERDSNGYFYVKLLEWNSYGANVLVEYTTEPSSNSNIDLPDGVTPYFKNLDELISNVEMKAFTPDGVTSEENFKLLSKYYDQATEYKHTFMKNEDGSYYWVKSEIIK